MEEQRIGILGGTFDPIHCGHLVAAEAARERFRLQRVIFIPTGIPPHKEPATVTDFWHRYLMVALAVLTNPYFDVSRLEYERGGITYTVDTMRQLREIYGTAAELFFITGSDTILEIFGWKEPEQLLSLCKFIVAVRPGFDMHFVEKVLGKYYRTRVYPLEMPQLGISSSDIRRRVREGRSIRYLVPEAVEAYIRRERLYVASKG
ncbi:nicotinate-nucleotide adenylyltransferase NadD [Thermacetogenium phaeum DSM 12270]|jgi:nicotinate-nucleotide adenylyltransferase|uniref:Probable nicotinate-nucleotide adenylyltransferase n=1 Tax=Thermacetogenium phaeum (strain ATCC BAA-254 / DSM 26808 / PB) TaxID=1089553 RepID=K4LJX9_THEPS|nr:nicotinate-nucleotide adenylyltransferase [Thermacetogenium phaeum]AFV12347.1 nicotinate-nucleotide adenylyltransferase NadD [Thermacetogenium phaeum DSM 12270]